MGSFLSLVTCANCEFWRLRLAMPDILCAGYPPMINGETNDVGEAGSMRVFCCIQLQELRVGMTGKLFSVTVVHYISCQTGSIVS